MQNMYNFSSQGASNQVCRQGPCNHKDDKCYQSGHEGCRGGNYRRSPYLKLEGRHLEGNGVPEMCRVCRKQRSGEEGQGAVATAVRVGGTGWKTAWWVSRDEGVSGWGVYNSARGFWLGHGRPLKLLRRGEHEQWGATGRLPAPACLLQIRWQLLVAGGSPAPWCIQAPSPFWGALLPRNLFGSMVSCSAGAPVSKCWSVSCYNQEFSTKEREHGDFPERRNRGITPRSFQKGRPKGTELQFLPQVIYLFVFSFLYGFTCISRITSQIHCLHECSYLGVFYLRSSNEEG